MVSIHFPTPCCIQIQEGGIYLSHAKPLTFSCKEGEALPIQVDEKTRKYRVIRTDSIYIEGSTLFDIIRIYNKENPGKQKPYTIYFTRKEWVYLFYMRRSTMILIATASAIAWGVFSYYLIAD